MEKMLMCLKDLAEEMGPASLEQNVDLVISSLELFLEKATFCQNRKMAAVSDGEGEDEEENSEGEDSEDMDHDEIILGNTTDVIIAMSAAFGDSFLLFSFLFISLVFKNFHVPLLSSRTSSS